MTNQCKTCKKHVSSGIWMPSQFADEKVLLFCSDKCKDEYIKLKLGRIKSSYPKYYDKIIKNPDKNIFFTDYIKKHGDER